MTQQKNYGSRQARFQLLYRQNCSEITKELAMIRNGDFLAYALVVLLLSGKAKHKILIVRHLLQEEDINTVYSAVAPIRLYDEKLIIKFLRSFPVHVPDVTSIDFYQ